MPDMNTDRMVWVDLETFGLDPETDPILEIGFVITDKQLDTIDDLQITLWESPWYDTLYDQAKEQNSFVFQMHNTGHEGYSPLWTNARMNGLESTEVEAKLFTWLSGYGINKGDPLCGSSVAFDRGFLKQDFPNSEKLFSYRNIDTSSIKEVCARYNPGLYARLDEVTKPKKYHRSLPDILDTIEEFKFYRDEFLMTEEFFGDE